MADRVHHPRDVLRVGRGAAQQLARADAVVVGRVEPQRVGEERVAHAGVGVGAVADRVQVAERARADLEQPDGEQHEQPDEQRFVVARHDPVVDRVLDDERRGHGARLPEQPGEHGARDAMPLRAHDRAHESPRRGAASFEFPHGPNLPTDEKSIEQRFPRPSVMGVVNVTPDSFSDGGVNFDPEDAVAAARRMLDEGAAIVDVGGESTRPGAEGVAVDEELRRVVPVLEQLAGAPVSIDTSKAEVARRALELGAELVNDVTALRGDPALAEVVAESGAYLCLMHMQGEPRTMQADPRYDDVVSEVAAFLEERLRAAVAPGSPRSASASTPASASARRSSTTSSSCGVWTS